MKTYTFVTRISDAPDVSRTAAFSNDRAAITQGLESLKGYVASNPGLTQVFMAVGQWGERGNVSWLGGWNWSSGSGRFIWVPGV